MATVIKDGTVHQNDCLIKAGVLIESKKIRAIGIDLDAENVTDAQGILASPGLVDVRVHCRGPGQTYKEDIGTGSKAAIRGGSTTIGAMSNATPISSTSKLMKKMVEENRSRGVVHIFQYGPITNDETTDIILDYAALKKVGAFASSNGGYDVQTAQTMYLAMRKAEKNDLITTTRAQDDPFFSRRIVNEGMTVERLDLPPVTELAETTRIARGLLLAQKTGIHYHICHVSTKTSVELVHLAKIRGINVTCEVAPRHILLTDNDIPKDNGYFRMGSPLRNREDQTALLAGLLDEIIDLIATDRAPRVEKEKQSGMKDAAFGITGSETAFSTLHTRFVGEEKVLRFEQLLVPLSDKSAGVFGTKNAGVLGPGKNADITIFDIEYKAEIKRAGFRSKGINTPSTSQEAYGETVMTLVGGEAIYQRGTK